MSESQSETCSTKIQGRPSSFEPQQERRTPHPSTLKIFAVQRAIATLLPVHSRLYSLATTLEKVFSCSVMYYKHPVHHSPAQLHAQMLVLFHTPGNSAGEPLRSHTSIPTVVAQTPMPEARHHIDFPVATLLILHPLHRTAARQSKCRGRSLAQVHSRRFVHQRGAKAQAKTPCSFEQPGAKMSLQQ